MAEQHTERNAESHYQRPTKVLPRNQRIFYQPRTEKLTEKSTVKLTSKVYQVVQDSLNHRRYWNQPPPEDFHRWRRIRGRRSQEKITGKDHGRSEKSTKISTEMPTELPTKKQSTEMSTKMAAGRSPMLCSEPHY